MRDENVTTSSHLPPPPQVEDSGSGSGALLVLQTQEQAPSLGMAPRVHPPMAGGKQIMNKSELPLPEIKQNVNSIDQFFCPIDLLIFSFSFSSSSSPLSPHLLLCLLRRLLYLLFSSSLPLVSRSTVCLPAAAETVWTLPAPVRSLHPPPSGSPRVSSPQCDSSGPPCPASPDVPPTLPASPPT